MFSLSYEPRFPWNKHTVHTLGTTVLDYLRNIVGEICILFFRKSTRIIKRHLWQSRLCGHIERHYRVYKCWYSKWLFCLASFSCYCGYSLYRRITMACLNICLTVIIIIWGENNFKISNCWFDLIIASHDSSILL